MKAILSFFCITTACHFLSAQSVPLANPDFEDVTGMTITAPGSVYTGTPAGWTFNANGEVQILAYGYCGNLLGGLNQHFLEAHTSAELGTLSQRASGLVSGASYQLSFLWGNRGDSCHPGLDRFHFEIRVGGQAFSRTGSGHVDMTIQTLYFIATGTSENIEIEFFDPGSASHTNGAVDAFVLTQVTSGTPGISTPYGSGCGNLALSLHSTLARPIIGSVMDVLIANIPAQTVVLALGFSRSSIAGVPLPYSLAGIGMPGCDLWQSLDFPALTTVFASGANRIVGLPVPNDTVLVGYHVFLQGLAPSPGVNPANLVVSNGLDVRIGNF